MQHHPRFQPCPRRPIAASRLRPVAAAACAVVVLACWQHAAAAPMLTTSIGRAVGASGCLETDTQHALVGPLTQAQSCAPRIAGSPTAHGFARADHGSLGASVSLTLANAGLITLGNSGFAISEFTGDYLVSGPGSSVNVQLNLLLDGLLALSANGANGGDSARVAVSLSSPFGSFRTASLSIRSNGAPIITNTLDGDLDFGPLLGAGDGDVEIDTDSFAVPVGTPFALRLALSTSGAVATLGTGPVESSVSLFGSSLSFVAGRDVFTLPAGYTVNGTAVVDNRWTGATSAVPEPGTGAMALAGLAGLALFMQRRLKVDP